MLSTVKSHSTRAILGIIMALPLAAASAAGAGQTAGAAAPSPASFPPEAYTAFGSSMGQGGHFGDIGWNDEQFTAFIQGMHDAFLGKAGDMDDTAHQLSAEMNRRISELDTGTTTPGHTNFPLSAYTAVGTSMGVGGHFGELGWTEAQFDAFADGMHSAYIKKPFEVGDPARELAAAISRKISEIEAAEQVVEPFDPGKLVQYMKDARKRYHLQLSDSGLGYNITTGRNGIRPRPGDIVVISCNALAADGTTKLPQLSSDRIRTRLEQMFPGFREGLQMMTVDSHAVFVLPPALTFGHGEWPKGVAPGSPLVFEVTLNDVISAPAAQH